MLQETPHRKRGQDPLKDSWRTPRSIFDPLNARWGFAMDAAADAENALADCYIDAGADALKTDWMEHLERHAAGLRPPHDPAAWLNPPYSSTIEFARRCVYSAKGGMVVVALLPSTTDVRWFHECVLGVATEVWHYTGRLAFVHPTTLQRVAGNATGSMLVVWTPGGPGWAGTRYGSISHTTGMPVRDEDVAYWRPPVARAARA